MRAAFRAGRAAIVLPPVTKAAARTNVDAWEKVEAPKGAACYYARTETERP